MADKEKDKPDPDVTPAVLALLALADQRDREADEAPNDAALGAFGTCVPVQSRSDDGPTAGICRDRLW